jgi:hypothetical protein
MQNIIVVHSNIKSNFFNITHVSYLYNNGLCSSMTSSHGGMCPWVPLRPLLMSIHGVAFTVTDGTIYFIFHLIEVTRTIHIIIVTLLHIVHLIMKVLLLRSPLPHRTLKVASYKSVCCPPPYSTCCANSDHIQYS